MHEQDVRRAVGRPGNLDSAPARHTAEYLAESLGYVLGKEGRRAARHHAWCWTWRAARRSRSRSTDTAAAGALTEIPADPTVALHMDRESFIRLAGGRVRRETVSVTVAGDEELAARILAGMAITP